MDYQKVVYGIELELGGQQINLGVLHWADVTGSVDGRRFHFKDPTNKEGLDFTVSIGGRALNSGEKPGEYTDEEIHLAMLLAIKDYIVSAFQVASQKVKEGGFPDDQRVDVDVSFPTNNMMASHDHLQKAVAMVHAPTRS